MAYFLGIEVAGNSQAPCMFYGETVSAFFCYFLASEMPAQDWDQARGFIPHEQTPLTGWAWLAKETSKTQWLQVG